MLFHHTRRRHRIRRAAGIAALLVVAALPPAPAESIAAADGVPDARPGADHAVPLHGRLVAGWDAPDDDPYAAGHRGADVAASDGTPVRASAAGIVSFAGNVAGNRTVTVDHGGGIRTTYSFLGTISVAAGTSVERGRVVGTVGLGHPGTAHGPHVHLSARRDGVYFDPLWLYVGDAYDDIVSLVA